MTLATIEGHRMTKREISIEMLLRWAYREELPKAQPISPVMPSGFGGPWGSITRMGELGGSVQEPDIRNRFGLVPDFTADMGPKDDAVRVWQAVQALDTMDPDLPEDWAPISDLGDLGPLGAAAIVRGLDKLTVIDRTGRRHLRTGVGFLIRKHALLANAPPWNAQKPEVKQVRYANGMPRYFIRDEAGNEVDGFDRKRRLPKAGAYTKPYLDPDPVDAIIARGEYEIWHAALGVLARDLAGRLDEFDPLPSKRPSRPWEEPEEDRPRVLADNRPLQTITREPRPIAGPLLPRFLLKPPRTIPLAETDRIGIM